VNLTPMKEAPAFRSRLGPAGRLVSLLGVWNADRNVTDLTLLGSV
jgi:hypothetical protein